MSRKKICMTWMPDDKIVLRKEIIASVASKYKDRRGKTTFRGFAGHFQSYVKSSPECLKIIGEEAAKEKELWDNKTIRRALNLEKEMKDNGAKSELRDLLCFYAYGMSWEEVMIELLGKEYDYKIEKEISDSLRRNEKKDTIEDIPKIDQVANKMRGQAPSGGQGRLVFFIPIAILIVLVILFTQRQPMQVRLTPTNIDFEKKQVESVLDLYQKLINCSLEIKYVFKQRNQFDLGWEKDSGDYFYESHVMKIPFLQMEEELFTADSNGVKIIRAKYLKGKLISGYIYSPSQIVDTFAPGVYLVEVKIEGDTNLSNRVLISDLIFSSADFFDEDIIEYTNSIYIPDSIKKHLSDLMNHSTEMQSLNKTLTEGFGDVMILGRIGSTPEDFTGYTPSFIWHRPSDISQRVHLKDIFLMTDQLKNAISDFLKSKNISIDLHS